MTRFGYGRLAVCLATQPAAGGPQQALAGKPTERSLVQGPEVVLMRWAVWRRRGGSILRSRRQAGLTTHEGLFA